MWFLPKNTGSIGVGVLSETREWQRAVHSRLKSFLGNWSWVSCLTLTVGAASPINAVARSPQAVA